MEKYPLISIVVAVLNGATTLQRCIDNIINQSFKSVELIIMDGGSSDNTPEILRKNASHLSYYESAKDRGIAHAWNKALGHVTGEWILFLGADDRFHDKNVLSDLAEFLNKDASTDLVYGQSIFEGGPANGQVYGEQKDLRGLRKRMIIPHTATFHHNIFFNEVGPFDEKFKIAMDYEIMLRKKSLSARFVNRCITVMGGNGISTRFIIKSLLESRAAQLKNKVDWRIKIEFWHAFYQLRHQFNLLHQKKTL